MKTIIYQDKNVYAKIQRYGVLVKFKCWVAFTHESQQLSPTKVGGLSI